MDLTLVALLAFTLLSFVWIGLRAGAEKGSFDDYITARNSQSAFTLTLSFVASGLGAWILFVPPEIGAFVGPIGLAGYAVAAALPFLILVWFGPAIRQRMPQGRSLAEYAELRFGPLMRYWLTGLSLLYMLCFITAELTALSAIAGLTGQLPGHWVMAAVVLTTLLYTSLGGLRASMATDRLQGWLVLGLVLTVCASIALYTFESPTPLSAPPAIPLAPGLGVALTLVIAVAAANLFHQGYWQRIWSAQDDRALKTGSLWAALITMVVIAMVGGLGMLTMMLGQNPGQPPAPFFVLIGHTSPMLAATVMVLATALVASSVDSLQNALASLLVTFRHQNGSTSILQARWLTVLLMLPVFGVALQGVSVLRIFLVADLLCATAVVPVLLGFWKRMTPLSAITGCVAGLVGAVVPGWIETGNWMAGLLLASFPNNTPTLGPFAGALLASTLATLMVAFGPGTTKRTA